MHGMSCVLRMTSGYHENLGKAHWMAVKSVHKYLRIRAQGKGLHYFKIVI